MQFNPMHQRPQGLDLNEIKIALPRHRRMTIPVAVRSGGHIVTIGGISPIRVQSMTNTDTSNVLLTALQIKELVLAGSELVRLAVNTREAAAAVPKIREQLDRMNIDVPLIGDFHYNGHLLLTEYPGCAETLSKYRINPGNIGDEKKQDTRFSQIIELACRYDKPVRIGVNWGSIDQDVLKDTINENTKYEINISNKNAIHEALIQSAIGSAMRAESLGMRSSQIVLSCKVSVVQDLIIVYRKLAQNCTYPLHLGLTEAGMGRQGIIASSIGIGTLLQEGIGDTIRISLTPGTGELRTQEVFVAQDILQTIGLRFFEPTVISCPGCGRTSSNNFQRLAKRIKSYLSKQMPIWRQHYDYVEHLKVAVMGCIVNGPGESKHANIGISLPGSGECPIALVYIDGEKVKTLRGNRIAEEFEQIICEYVDRHFGKDKRY